MSYKAKGKITEIKPIETFDSGSKKITFVIDSGEQYSNIYAFDLFKGAQHVQHVDNFPTYNKVGDQVEVEFNINCNEYNGKYYTNLPCWKCTKLGGETTASNQMSPADEKDDLPF
jgi:hypothetical protein